MANTNFSLKIALALFLISNSIWSQSSNKVKIEEFKSALNRDFTKITTGTSFSNLGNFASISSDSKSFTLNGNFIAKESIFGIELSGGATEGIFKLFNNQELNSNFGGQFSYHKLLKTDFAARDYFAIDKIESELSSIDEKFSKDSLDIVEKKQLYQIQSQIIKGMGKSNQINSKIKTIDSLIQVENLPRFKKDSLITEKELMIIEIKAIRQDSFKLSNKLISIKIDSDSYFLEELEKREQLKDEEKLALTKKKKELKLEGFDITWLSFGLKVNNNDFKIFEESNIVSRQFIDTSFISQRFSASFSRYKSNILGNQDVYWSAGLFIDYSTNFNSLSKVLIEDRRPITGNNLQEQVKSINAYTGNYEEGIIELTLYYDYYRFFGTYNSILGIHLNPSYSLSEISKKPITNFYLGIIVPFGDSKKQTSKLNVEVFYNKQDVFNYLKKENRSGTFGVRATLPVNLITK